MVTRGEGKTEQTFLKVYPPISTYEPLVKDYVEKWIAELSRKNGDKRQRLVAQRDLRRAKVDPHSCTLIMMFYETLLKTVDPRKLCDLIEAAAEEHKELILAEAGVGSAA